MTGNRSVSSAELEEQRRYSEKVREISSDRAAFLGRPLRAHIDTYGCQQNENDSEKLMGMLMEMGYSPWETREGADIIIINTCAVREHAEQRVYGNLGALKKLKEKRPGLIVGMCGCMAQEQHISDAIAQKYRHVNLLFGPQALYRLPELLYRYIDTGKNVVENSDTVGRVAEGIPQARRAGFASYISIMSGCNNFCSYCIVPYVRGRERSRAPEDVLKEVREVVAAGSREITLLGQNVNSYGNDTDFGVDFAGLLAGINAVDGDFRVKFMTSHPKDITHNLLDTMASCEKVCKHLHLPVQSGSNRVLDSMNRRYTRESYLDTIAYARKVMPGITFTSDIIVGFPGETAEDFEDTLSLVREVRYDMLFSFIFSRRRGTPAYDMAGQIPYSEKLSRFNALLKAQDEISAQCNAKLEGSMQRVLCTGRDEKNADLLTSRTASNKLVFFPGEDCLIGKFADIKITQAKTWFLFGEKQGE